MPKKKNEDNEPAVKKSTLSVKGIRFNASSAKIGFIYAELLGRPVSKKRCKR